MDNEDKLRWDDNLVLSNEYFGEQLTTDHYDFEEASKNPFPTDYALAQIAKVAIFNRPHVISEDWILLTTAKSDNVKSNYFGVAFFHPKLCQIVIAHRGLSIPSAFVTHNVALFHKMTKEIVESASTFVYMVIQRIKSWDFQFQLSITGYSLGAWLAQITTFTAKYFKIRRAQFVADEEFFKNIHPHTVVFCSPGCRSYLEKIIKASVPFYVCRKYINYDYLDMTVYLSDTSSVKAEEQVGTIYLLQPALYTMNDYLRLFNVNTHLIERKLVLDFMDSSKTMPCDPNECSLNVFNNDELIFLKTACILARNCPNSTFANIIQKFSIPEFYINMNLRRIRSENLNGLIGFVKLAENKNEILNSFWQSM